MKLKTGLIIGDCHHPYVDQQSWKLLLKAGAFLQPAFLVVMGDFIDCYSISAHRKDPNRKNFDYEVSAAKQARAQLDDLGAKEKHFCAGNHEYRLARHLMDNAPQYVNMLKIEEILELKKYGWKYTPYGRSTRIGKVNFTHDVDGKAGANAHTSAQKDFNGNVVIGHTHRMAVNYSGSLRGDTHVAITIGWLGDAEACDYKHYAKAMKEWHHGFGVALLEPNGNMHIQAVPIVGGRCVVNGKLLSV